MNTTKRREKREKMDKYMYVYGYICMTTFTHGMRVHAQAHFVNRGHPYAEVNLGPFSRIK